MSHRDLQRRVAQVRVRRLQGLEDRCRFEFPLCTLIQRDQARAPGPRLARAEELARLFGSIDFDQGKNHRVTEHGITRDCRRAAQRRHRA
jgi:hypothetical protein